MARNLGQRGTLTGPATPKKRCNRLHRPRLVPLGDPTFCPSNPLQGPRGAVRSSPFCSPLQGLAGLLLQLHVDRDGPAGVVPCWQPPLLQWRTRSCVGKRFHWLDGWCLDPVARCRAPYMESRRYSQSTGGPQIPVGGLEQNLRDVGTFTQLPA
jgi:hypothetical protein